MYKVTFKCTKGLFEVISQFTVHKTSGNFDILLYLAEGGNFEAECHTCKNGSLKTVLDRLQLTSGESNVKFPPITIFRKHSPLKSKLS